MFYDEAVVLIKTEDVINQLTFGYKKNCFT